MAKNYFIANSSNELINVNREIINWFKAKQYEVESRIVEGKYFIQAKKTGTIRTLLGANLAFQINIYWSKDVTIDNEFIVETSIGKWISNIAGAGFTYIFLNFLTGGIPIVTGLANAGWALILESELISYIENTLNLKKVAKIDNYSQDTTQNSSPVIDVNYSKVPINSAREKAKKQVQQELNKLEDALKQGVITPQQFANKKAVLDEKIDEYEAEFLVEEKIAKLQEAFQDGILDTFEYEQKVKEVHEKIYTEVIETRKQQKKQEKIAKLKEALDSGILTEEEYRKKIAQL
jgi:hypothetical protein